MCRRATEPGVLDADRAGVVEHHLRDQRVRVHVEIRPRHHGVQVRACGRQPPSAVDVAVERRDVELVALAGLWGGDQLRKLFAALEAKSAGAPITHTSA